MLFSFIIPVFNTDLKFLKKSINSIINQNCKDIEIIIVDDFSNTKIVKFLKDLKKKYNLVKIFRNKSNKGPAYSRNIGIKLSTGRYICFVDSDDYILMNSIKYIKKALIKNHHPDLVAAQFDSNISSLRNDSRSKNVKFKHINFKSNKIQKVFTNAFQNFSKKYFIIDTVWGYFYSRKFLFKNKIFFENKARIGEDIEFIIKSLIQSKRTLFVRKKIYYYRVHNNNLSFNNSVSEIKRINGNLKIASNLSDFFLKNKISKQKLTIPLKIITHLINSTTPLAYGQNRHFLLSKNQILNKIKHNLKRYLKIKTISNFTNIKKKYNQLFNQLLSKIKNKIVFIYCGYETSLPIIKFLKKKKIRIGGIIDSNYNLNNTYLANIKISNFNSLNNISKKDKFTFLVSHPNKNTYLLIKRNLLSAGFHKNNITHLKRLNFLRI